MNTGCQSSVVQTSVVQKEVTARQFIEFAMRLICGQYKILTWPEVQFVNELQGNDVFDVVVAIRTLMLRKFLEHRAVLKQFKFVGKEYREKEVRLKFVGGNEVVIMVGSPNRFLIPPLQFELWESSVCVIMDVKKAYEEEIPRYSPELDIRFYAKGIKESGVLGNLKPCAWSRLPPLPEIPLWYGFYRTYGFLPYAELYEPLGSWKEREGS